MILLQYPKSQSCREMQIRLILSSCPWSTCHSLFRSLQSPARLRSVRRKVDFSLNRRLLVVSIVSLTLTCWKQFFDVSAVQLRVEAFQRDRQNRIMARVKLELAMQSTAGVSRLLPSVQRQFSRLKCSDLFSIRPLPRQLQFRNIHVLSAKPCTSLPGSLHYVPFTSHVRQVGISASRRHVSTQSEPAPAQALQKAPSRELLLSPPALVVTRDYEWANIIIGFEQANRYTIRAAPGGEVVGFLAEVCSTVFASVTKSFRSQFIRQFV